MLTSGSLLAFDAYPLWINLAIFVVASAVVWYSGTRLAAYADVIAERTGLGQAFIGLLLLATATSLPEVATTVTATLIGNVPLVVGNLLGGVSMQTVILAVMDAVVVTRGALTRRTPEPALLLQGLMLVLLLTLVLTSIALGGGPALFHVGVGTLALVVIYPAGTYLSQRYERHPRWRPLAPAMPGEGGSGSDSGQVEQAEGDQGRQIPTHRAASRQRYEETATSTIMGFFALGAAAILAAGWAIAQAGDALAKQTGIGDSLVGFVLVAVATSLPEVSTTLSAARLGAYGMAVANIFGGNAFDTMFLFVADVLYRDGPVLAAVESWAAFAAGLGIVLTCLYLWGLVERSDRTVARIGVDSALVVILYLLGVAALYALR